MSNSDRRRVRWRPDENTGRRRTTARSAAVRNDPTSVGNRNLANLRKSIAWEGSNAQDRIEALQGRLEELLILELDIDDGRRFLRLSVRGLYKYVLSTITSPLMHPVRERDTDNEQDDELDLSFTKSKPRPLVPVLQETEQDTTGRAENEGVGTKRPQREDKAGKETDKATYRERLGGYLHPRDMRRLVTPFSASNEPALIVRRHAMLLNFDPLRTIILRDRLLVIVPDGADSILGLVESTLRGDSSHSARDFLDDRADLNFRALDRHLGNSAQEEQKRQRLKMLSSFLKKRSGDSGDLQEEGNDKGTADDEADGDGDGDADKDADEDEDADATASDEEGSSNNDWNQFEGKEWVDLPFELQCADAVLHVVTSILQKDTYDLQKAALDYIQRLLSDDGAINDDPLTIIRAVKDGVGEMSSRVKGFVQSLNRVLDEDEDMALMNLSRLLSHPERFIKPVSQAALEEESDEPELILEAHLQTGLTLMNSLNLINGQIITASEMVNQKLDTIRNKLLLVNILVSVLSLCITSASLVGSFFGMNLINPYEDSEDAFSIVTFSTVAGSLTLGAIVMFILFQTGTIPRVRTRTGFLLPAEQTEGVQD